MQGLKKNSTYWGSVLVLTEQIKSFLQFALPRKEAEYLQKNQFPALLVAKWAMI